MMRKLLTFFLVLLLVFSIPLSAAAGVIVTRQGEATPGEEIVFEVRLSKDTTAKTGAIHIDFDPEVLEVVSYHWNLTAPLLQHFDPKTGDGAFAYLEPITVGDLIFTVTFRVKDTAVYGDAAVTVNTQLSQSGNPSQDKQEDTVDSEIYVSCTNHSPVIPATCTKPTTCIICGASYVEIPEHTPGQWTAVEAQGVEKLFCTVCHEELDSRPLETPYQVGDVDGNGKVNSMDYVLVKRHVMGTFSLDKDRLTRADINGDGRINIADYTLVKRIVLGTYKP